MATERWTVRASKPALDDLLKELQGIDENNQLGTDDLQPQKVPRDPDGPMGQIEWYEIVFALATGVAGNALYDGAKGLIQKFVAGRPNQASVDVKKS